MKPKPNYVPPLTQSRRRNYIINDIAHKCSIERALVVLRCLFITSQCSHFCKHPFFLNPRMPCSFLIVPHCTSREFWTKNECCREKEQKETDCKLSLFLSVIIKSLFTYPNQFSLVCFVVVFSLWEMIAIVLGNGLCLLLI